MLNRLRTNQGQRGQLLPLWTAVVIVCFVLTFILLNYGNQIRWQIRAQNAADSAASAAIGIQAERFNLEMMMLYGINVEEYRARRLLEATLNATFGAGGCTLNSSNLADTSFGSCGYVYGKLRDPFIRSVKRFDDSARTLQMISAKTTYANWSHDATELLSHLQVNCNNSGTSLAAYKPDGGDCSFKYSFAPSGLSFRTGIKATSMDAESILIPSLGRISPNILPDTQSSLWTPATVDVVVCALIPPIVPNFGPFKFLPTYAVGRGAATSIMIEQDWLQPGALDDPAHASLIAAYRRFQPVEDYVDTPLAHDFSLCGTANGTTCMQSSGGIDWYNVNYGGVATTVDVPRNAFIAPVAGYEMSARTGWWGSYPIRPFGGSFTLDSTRCK